MAGCSPDEHEAFLQSPAIPETCLPGEGSMPCSSLVTVFTVRASRIMRYRVAVLIWAPSVLQQLIKGR